jgi:hypothetical protein
LGFLNALIAQETAISNPEINRFGDIQMRRRASIPKARTSASLPISAKYTERFRFYWDRFSALLWPIFGEEVAIPNPEINTLSDN